MHAGSIKCDGPIDAAIGRRIRALRVAKGVSQSALAGRVGVAVQQIQKYEKGAIRIGVGRLIEIVAALRLPLNALLQQVEQASAACEDPVKQLSSGQAVRLAQAFAKLQPRCDRRARPQRALRTRVQSSSRAAASARRRR